MARVARTCLRSILKIVNSTLGLVGIAMILYGFWMLRVLQRDMESPSFDDFDSTALWFIYAFLSIGVALCLITCLGHISADSSNGICLSCDLPEDPTGRFHDFREFVESNFDFFKWIAMFIVLVQGFSILLAMTLRALGPNNGSKYDIDEEYTSARLPLINPHSQTPPYVVGEPRFPIKNDAWNVRIHFQLTIGQQVKENHRIAICSLIQRGTRAGIIVETAILVRWKSLESREELMEATGIF
ncbi:hypothetical protein POTOM_039425 [Populus tomentosa]|uniref:Tetraspanin family protein n=1 Tax=Populus tomentosa TaxID=118781 RepID=A0A8X7YRW3_POPTO|nr:hypothetical protein POTOM_039425 [Populus tomentosa]